MTNRFTAQSRLDIKSPSRTQVIPPEFAASGFLVEVDLATGGGSTDRRFFAVGIAAANEAVEAVLGYPGLLREDRRSALRPLSPEEICKLRLRPQAVRPYGVRRRDEKVSRR